VHKTLNAETEMLQSRHDKNHILDFKCLFIDNNTRRYIVVYSTKAKALTGASDATKYKRKYKFQIANLKTVNMIMPLGFAQLRTIQKI